MRAARRVFCYAFPRADESVGGRNLESVGDGYVVGIPSRLMLTGLRVRRNSLPARVYCKDSEGGTARQAQSESCIVMKRRAVAYTRHMLFT